MSTAKQAKDWAAGYSIDRARILFEKTENTFHAWEAFRWARWNDQPVPDWVMSYFDGCAEALKKTKPKNARAVAQAFGMAKRGGGTSKSGLALCESDQLALFQSVMAIKGMTPVWSDKDIFAHVAAQHDVSDEYVEKMYYRFRS